MESHSPGHPEPLHHSFRYQAYFCEENIWWLCQEPALGEGKRWVVFISNDERACPMWCQRAVPPGEMIVWDYHVVAMVEAAQGLMVWDLDTRLGLPTPIKRWAQGSFPHLARTPTALSPRFRMVEAAEFLAKFSTDRSHMRNGRGKFVKPPPEWPAPQAAGTAMNLMRWIDMADPWCGRVVTLGTLLSGLPAS
jgi:hypothetical protein